jgi:protein-S-isoprenylcysteine O-methyltransferase Ste14
MSTQQTTDRPSPQTAACGVATVDEQLRHVAIEQIERKRRFQMRAVLYAAASIVAVVVWAISEYNNAGGWPSHGFSQSSGSPHLWNIWIVYPVLALGLALAIDAWNTYGRRKVSESEIRREIDRIAGRY